MIYAKLNYGGRIGNMLFIIGTGLTLARRMGVEFRCLVNCRFENYIEQFFDNIFRDIKFVYELPPGLKMYDAQHFYYEELPLEDNICLCGWFQTEKYLDRELMLSYFRVTEQRKEQLTTKYPVLAEPNVTSINVRRGDYLKLAAYFPVCGASYYKKCMKLIGRGGKFIISSDDIEWCKRNFRGDNIVFVENSDILTDLYVQSLCAHNIISNGTFSWWGAWLNENPNKRVLAPKKWFGPGNWWHDTRDVVPNQWQRVANPLSFVQKIAVCKYYVEQVGVKYRSLRSKK